jgi:hypothetical protein
MEWPPRASGHRRAAGPRSLRGRLEPDLSVGPVAERLVSGLAAAAEGVAILGFWERIAARVEQLDVSLHDLGAIRFHGDLDVCHLLSSCGYWGQSTRFVQHEPAKAPEQSGDGGRTCSTADPALVLPSRLRRRSRSMSSLLLRTGQVAVGRPRTCGSGPSPAPRRSRCRRR